MDDRVVEVRCSGCGETVSVLELREGAPAEAEELLARLQESPPFCVVCACRTMVGPRPGVEFWERIGRSATEGSATPERQVEGLHDEVSY